MKKRVVSKFHSGQKLILFAPSSPPCIAWVSENIHGKSIYKTGKNRYMVKVTRHEDDRDEGRGVFTASANLQPYTDTLWDQCVIWMADMKIMQDRLKKLSKGKI